jgi:hypothetical protein
LSPANLAATCRADILGLTAASQENCYSKQQFLNLTAITTDWISKNGFLNPSDSMTPGI